MRIKRFITLLLLFFLVPGFSLAETLTLSFLGDCSIGQMPESEGREGSYTRVLDENGLDWPFSLVRSILEQDDFTFANNEVVFTTRKKHQDKKTNLCALPQYAEVYHYSGVDAVNTANNHAWDFFEAGYQDTLQALDDFSIPHFGSLYVGTGHAYDHLGIYEVKGVRIGAMGFSYPQDSKHDLNMIAERAEQLRAEGCQLVIACLHWGREVHSSPQSWQFTFAKKVLDAGVDVIWGQHPHILQQVQFYKGKPIFYSTGNFTFGSMSAVDPDTGIFQLRYELTEEGLSLTNFTVIPCRTQGKGDFRPYPLTDEAEKTAMLKKLIYTKPVRDMENLPKSFLENGSVDIRDGALQP